MEYVVGRSCRTRYPHQLMAAVATPTPVQQATQQQRRRMDLEKEVATLKQQLCKEDTVQQVLESHSSFLLSDIIPPKTKELLAEIVLVEQEIARLETQIHTLKNASYSHSNGREIKSMFFINQAMTMNNDYLKRHHLDDKTKTNMSLEQKPPREGWGKKGEEHPNKLSERILKCLVCIFIRQLRSSRAAELEKSSNLARSSFRIDTGLIIKDRGQQDHYGIFAINDSIVRDIGPYKNLVSFTSSSLDRRGFSASPLLPKLREMLEALQQVDLRPLTHQQKLAFWLNIYNTCIMHGILQHDLPTSSEKLLALKKKAIINVSGDKLNALVIENFILKQPSSVREEDVEEQQVRGVYGLKSSEPNIVFALCCGTRSSPSLRIYKAERVMRDLEKAKLEYLQASLVVTSRRNVMIPELLKDTEESLLRWICEQLPTSWSLRKSMVDCIRSGGINDVIPYDYDFHYLLPPSM